MRIAEYFTEKKGVGKLNLFFTDRTLTKYIKKIPTALYHKNQDQWTLLYRPEIKKALLDLNFKIWQDNNNKLQIQNIKTTNNYIELLSNNLDTKYKIIKYFTKFDTSGCYSYKKFDFSKAKKVNFYQYKNNNLYIPIGLKNELLELIGNIKITDYRKLKKYKYSDNEIESCLGYLTLYPEQIQAVKACFKNGNGIIKCPTAFGKTEVFISICKLVDISTLILTTSIDLAKQTHKRIKKAGLDAGLVQGKNINQNHKIIIATVQSSHKLTNKFQMVIVDECHQVAELYNKILSDNSILYRFGFSATPFTKGKRKELKNLMIKQFIGDLIFEVQSESLQKDHKISVPYINMIKIKNEDLYEFSEEINWNLIEKLFITENYERNIRIINLCKKLETQTMILVKKIQHGKQLELLCLEKGLNCIFLSGDTKKNDREKVLSEYDLNRNNFILIGSKILFTGINLQNIFNLIYAAGGNSNIEVLQSLGRGLRSKTKTTVNFYDFYDLGNHIVKKHSSNRIKYYESEGFNNIKIIG